MDRIVTAMKRVRNMDATVTSQQDAHTHGQLIETSPLGTRQLAAHLAKHNVISLERDDDALDAYRILRTQVLNRMRTDQHRTLAIVAPTTGDGASHIAANLAVSLVMDPQNSVLLVDCDARNPRQHTLFDIPNHPGLTDYFSQNASLTQLLLHQPIERLTVLPAGAPLANFPELLGSAKMKQLIEALKAQDARRFVIFDLPAALDSANAVALAPLVDALLMVVAERRTHAERLVRSAEVLAGANLIGTVLNRASSR